MMNRSRRFFATSVMIYLAVFVAAEVLGVYQGPLYPLGGWIECSIFRSVGDGHATTYRKC
jgi:hypothetical protein